MQNLGTPQKRLKAFIDMAFRTQTEFTRALGVSRQFLQRYVNEKSDSIITNYKTTEKLKKLGLNTDWYLTGNGDMYNDKGVKRDELFNNIKPNARPMTENEKAGAKIPNIIKFMQATIPANSGLPSSLNEYIYKEKEMKVSSDSPGFVIFGDEMSPAVEHGYFVWTDPKAEIRVGDNAIWEINGVIVCRRVKEVKGESIVLIAFKKDTPEITTTREGYLGAIIQIDCKP